MSYTNSLLNYLVYPYLIAYIASASFTRCGRLQNAVKKNCMFYLLYLIAGIAVGCCVFFIPAVESQIKTTGPINVALGLSLALAFFILSIFVGYGIVGIPIYLWR